MFIGLDESLHFRVLPLSFILSLAGLVAPSATTLFLGLDSMLIALVSSRSIVVQLCPPNTVWISSHSRSPSYSSETLSSLVRLAFVLSISCNLSITYSQTTYAFLASVLLVDGRLEIKQGGFLDYGPRIRMD